MNTEKPIPGQGRYRVRAWRKDETVSVALVWYHLVDQRVKRKLCLTPEGNWQHVPEAHKLVILYQLRMTDGSDLFAEACNEMFFEEMGG